MFISLHIHIHTHTHLKKAFLTKMLRQFVCAIICIVFQLRFKLKCENCEQCMGIQCSPGSFDLYASTEKLLIFHIYKHLEVKDLEVTGSECYAGWAWVIYFIFCLHLQTEHDQAGKDKAHYSIQLENIVLHSDPPGLCTLHNSNPVQTQPQWSKPPILCWPQYKVIPAY